MSEEFFQAIAQCTPSQFNQISSAEELERRMCLLFNNPQTLINCIIVAEQPQSFSNERVLIVQGVIQKYSQKMHSLPFDENFLMQVLSRSFTALFNTQQNSLMECLQDLIKSILTIDIKYINTFMPVMQEKLSQTINVVLSGGDPEYFNICFHLIEISLNNFLLPAEFIQQIKTAIKQILFGIISTRQNDIHVLPLLVVYSKLIMYSHNCIEEEPNHHCFEINTAWMNQIQSLPSVNEPIILYIVDMLEFAVNNNANQSDIKFNLINLLFRTAFHVIHGFIMLHEVYFQCSAECILLVLKSFYNTYNKFKLLLSDIEFPDEWLPLLFQFTGLDDSDFQNPDVFIANTLIDKANQIIFENPRESLLSCASTMIHHNPALINMFLSVIPPQEATLTLLARNAPLLLSNPEFATCYAAVISQLTFPAEDPKSKYYELIRYNALSTLFSVLPQQFQANVISFATQLLASVNNESLDNCIPYNFAASILFNCIQHNANPPVQAFPPLLSFISLSRCEFSMLAINKFVNMYPAETADGLKLVIMSSLKQISEGILMYDQYNENILSVVRGSFLSIKNILDNFHPTPPDVAQSVLQILYSFYESSCFETTLNISDVIISLVNSCSDVFPAILQMIDQLAFNSSHSVSILFSIPNNPFTIQSEPVGTIFTQVAPAIYHFINIYPREMAAPDSLIQKLIVHMLKEEEQTSVFANRIQADDIDKVHAICSLLCRMMQVQAQLPCSPLDFYNKFSGEDKEDMLGRVAFCEIVSTYLLLNLEVTPDMMGAFIHFIEEGTLVHADQRKFVFMALSKFAQQPQFQPILEALQHDTIEHDNKVEIEYGACIVYGTPWPPMPLMLGQNFEGFEDKDNQQTEANEDDE